MSIVAGYVNRNGHALSTASIRELVEDYRILLSEQRSDLLVDVQQTPFGHLMSKYRRGYRHQTPTIIDQDGNILLTAGYILPRGSQDLDSHRQLLALCVETHGRALEECEGEFVSLFADSRSGAVHIVTDRFGAVPFFLLDAEDRALFSSNLSFLHFLAGRRLDSDILGWLQITACDHTIGGRTHLREVRRLLPGSHVILSVDRSDSWRYWRPRSQVGAVTEPKTAAVQVFEAFRSATERRVKWLGKGMVALSGGLDSRMVAGALPEDAEFSAWTFVESVESDDTHHLRVASEVCKILGLAHTIKYIPRGVLSPPLVRDLIALTGGLIAVNHSVKTMQGISVMRDEGVDAQMGGAPGDSLSGGYVRSPELLDPRKTDQSIRNFVQRMAGPSGANLLARIFRPDVLREHYPQLVTSLLESFDALEGPTAAHRVSLWKIMNRNFGLHFICPTHSHPDVSEAQPHLGYEYSDLLLQLPAPWLYRRVFYQFMLFECLPALRGVVYGNTGRRLSGTMQAADDVRRWVPYLSLRRFVGRSVRAMTPVRRRPQTFMYDLLQNAQLLDEMVDMVRSLPSLADVLDVEECVKFVADCRTGRIRGMHADDHRLLGTLATMCYTVDTYDRPSAGSFRPDAPRRAGAVR